MKFGRGLVLTGLCSWGGCGGWLVYCQMVLVRVKLAMWVSAIVSYVIIILLGRECCPSGRSDVRGGTGGKSFLQTWLRSPWDRKDICGPLKGLTPRVGAEGGFLGVRMCFCRSCSKIKDTLQQRSLSQISCSWARSKEARSEYETTRSPRTLSCKCLVFHCLWVSVNW